ncbi:hypothetical protein NC651_009170 [Populus alba x Populus x berolinensis]|nr:hypothetical protein NC651_009170 [Populus alba x Populus x berolinensis]
MNRRVHGQSGCPVMLFKPKLGKQPELNLIIAGVTTSREVAVPQRNCHGSKDTAVLLVSALSFPGFAFSFPSVALSFTSDREILSSPPSRFGKR